MKLQPLADVMNSVRSSLCKHKAEFRRNYAKAKLIYFFTHIIAGIWLASFYRFTVNKSTMSEACLMNVFVQLLRNSWSIHLFLLLNLLGRLAPLIVGASLPFFYFFVCKIRTIQKGAF